MSLEIIQAGKKTEAITMYGINPYAPVNPAMLGIQQQRLANFQPQMQQGYPQQQFTPQSSMPLMMKGRTVASLDEVKAAQIDLDGSLTYFPCPADNCIYAKAIDINGMPVIQTYKLSNDQAAAPKRYADAETVEALQQKVKSLERYLKGETQNANESVYNDANIQSAPQQPKPNGSNAENAGEQSPVWSRNGNGQRQKS
ncbi:hypothetical protein [Phascolarctobacterium sp.]